MIIPLVRVYEISELGRIREHIHDRYFELNRLSYNDKKKILRIPFESEQRTLLKPKWYHLFFARWRVPVFEYILEIEHVLSYIINDHSKIETYTFNEFRLNQSSNELTITACENLEIVINVIRMQALVIPTNKCLGTRTFYTMLGCEVSSTKREDYNKSNKSGQLLLF